MRPYGVKIIEDPDVADIRYMGAKGSAGRFPSRSGDYRPLSCGNSKSAIRRYWKRRARRAGRLEAQEGY